MARRRSKAGKATSTVSEAAGRFPLSQDVRNHLLQLAQRHSKWVKIQTPEHTSQGRPIDAVTLANPHTDTSDKQHVLIVAGQHGNEESARMVALGLIDRLLAPAGRKILDRQTVVVMPNVSPDAAEANTYETPAGVKPNLDHGPSGPTTPEGRALEAIALEFQPDVYVDIHGRGHAGCSYDMVLFPGSRAYTEDENILYSIARRMVAAGEKSGIPHVTHPLTWPGWGGPDPDQPSSTLWAYRQFKSLVFLTENTEHDDVAYPDEMRVKSGVARLWELLRVGAERHSATYYEGYPTGVVTGTFTRGVVAVGKTAATRRRSRIELWKHSSHMTALTSELPEQENARVITLEYNGPTLDCGFGIQVRAAHRRGVKRVRFNGKTLRAGEMNSYYTWQDAHTTYALAALPTLAKGKHRVEFLFE